MIRNLKVFFLICTVGLPSWQRSPDAQPVEAGHPVYPFLRSLAVKKAIPAPALGSLPLSKREVKAALDGALEAEASLTDWEKARLHDYRRELDDSLRAQQSPLAWRDGDQALLGSVSYYTGIFHRDSIPRADTYGFGTLTATVDGLLSENVSFTAGAFIGSERSYHPRFKMNYDPQRGLPYNSEQGRNSDPEDLDNVSTFDGYRVVFSYEAPRFRVDAGYDWNQWGFGQWQHPSFSTSPWFWVKESPTFDSGSGYQGDFFPGSYRRGYGYPGQGAPMLQARTVFNLGPFRYTKFFAERTGLFSDSSAHVSAHRLETSLPGEVKLGIYEVVVYSRPFEAAYALPLVPLLFAEHYLGDRDNIGLGFDASWIPTAGLRLHADLFLDDLLNPAELLGDYWGNKYAFSVGLETVDLLLKGSSFGLEYARVEPWVFGHHTQDNQMQHFGHLLGSSLPPNSQALRVSAVKTLLASIELGVHYHLEQREKSRRGGSIFEVHDLETDGNSKIFLSDNAETRHFAHLEGTLSANSFWWARISAGFLWIDLWQSNAKKTYSTPALAGEVGFKY